MTRDWREEEIVQVGAVEHYSYCPRQCGLIHLEATFEENLFTLRGRFAHERPDEPETTCEAGGRVERALPLWSERYGLIGKADVVEFRSGDVPFPVEYKSGRAKARPHEAAQLCAQALCLEEMFGKPVRKGAVYYVASKRRVEHEIDDELRDRTAEIIERIRAMRLSLDLPPPVADGRCGECSLKDACLPRTVLADVPWGALFHPQPETEPP